jgi:hypothetical protein
MHLLDPYGLGPATTSQSPAGEDEVAPAPGHAAEVELARQAASAEILEPDEDVSSSSIDPALRLQDAPEDWVGNEGGAQASEDATAEPAGEPYAPLIDSGGQGV